MSGTGDHEHERGKGRRGLEGSSFLVELSQGGAA